MRLTGVCAEPEAQGQCMRTAHRRGSKNESGNQQGQIIRGKGAAHRIRCPEGSNKARKRIHWIFSKEVMGDLGKRGCG